MRELHPSLCKIWRGGGWFLAGNHCRDTSYQQVPSRHATPGSCLRFPSTGGPPSCLLANPRHSTNVMAPFSRAPLNHSSLHHRTLLGLEILQELRIYVVVVVVVVSHIQRNGCQPEKTCMCVCMYVYLLNCT